MSVLQNKNILLGVSGGIAAYKTPNLVRLLIKKGANVKVVMTPMATQFVTPLSLATVSKNEVGTRLSDDQGHWTNHVELGLWADYMLIAPTTASTLSKLADGNSDNLLLTTYLSAKCPVYIAPAMDLDMYQHPTTKENLNKLKQNKVEIIPAESGELASGLVGEGRMAEPMQIISFLEQSIAEKLDLYQKKILLTAGPTFEPIDPVRFIGNHSSGKMGFALAEEAASRGAEVILISGPSHEIAHNKSIKRFDVQTALEMMEEVYHHYDTADIAIMSAAVADFRPKEVAQQKIKKGAVEAFSIELVKNPDILKSMGQNKNNQYLVGFALETQNERANAKKKLKEKNLDLIVLNSLQDKGAGFQVSTNKVHLIDGKNPVQSYELKSKREVAKDIFDYILAHHSFKPIN